ncbi:MAG: hypothetical protein IJV82_01080 [Oscillospiraceae bacterium]|nr:hypothetical protein [Oscillospiraceae bacterium]
MMESYWQGAAGVLIACLLAISLGKQGKDAGLLLALAVCSMVGLLAMSYLKPVIDFLQRLADVSNLQSDMLQILLKAVGIGLVGEFATLICVDAGNGAMGKAVQLLTSAAILWLSLPLLTQLLELLEDVLG